MDLVGDAIESAVPGVGDVTIGNPSWVSQSLLVGIPATMSTQAEFSSDKSRVT